MANNEIVTTREVATPLELGETTACTIAQSAKLPGFKVRQRWRFCRSDIDDWTTPNIEAGTASTAFLFYVRHRGWLGNARKRASRGRGRTTL